MATKDEALAKINEKPDADFIVRTAEEEAAFLANFKEQEVEKDIKTHIGKLHTQYEADFESVTGLKKPEGEKGYNWIKAEAKRLKEGVDKLSQAENKLKELEQQVKDGKIDAVTAKKIEEQEREITRLENLYKQKQQEWEQSIAEERNEFRTTRIKSELNHAMLGLKFMDTAIIDKAVQETYINRTIDELAQIADFDEKHGLIFRDSDKNIMRNKDAAVMTPSELLQSKLAPILDKGKVQPGLGTGKDGKRREETIHTDIVVPSTVDNLQKLTAYLRNNYPDLKPQSQEYITAFKKYSEGFKK